MEATPATAFQHNSWSGQPPPQQLPGFSYGQPAFSNYNDQTMSPTPFSLFSPSGPLPPQFTVGDGPHQAAASRDSRPYPLEDLDPLSPVNGSSLQQAAPTDGASLSDLESRLRALVTSLVDGSTSPGDARCIFDNLNQQIEVARRSSVNISDQQQQLNQSYPANGYAINTGYNTNQNKPTPYRADIEKIKINQIKIGDANECRNSLLEFNSILATHNLTAAAYGGPTSQQEQMQLSRLCMLWIGSNSEIMTEIRTQFGESPAAGRVIFHHIKEAFIDASVKDHSEAEKDIIQFNWNELINGNTTRTKLNELWSIIARLHSGRRADVQYWTDYIWQHVPQSVMVEYDMKLRSKSLNVQQLAGNSKVWFGRIFQEATISYSRKNNNNMIDQHSLNRHEKESGKQAPCTLCNGPFCPHRKGRSFQCDIHGQPTQDRVDYLNDKYPFQLTKIKNEREKLGKTALPAPTAPAPVASAPAAGTQAHGFPEESVDLYRQMAQMAINGNLDSMPDDD